MALVAVAVHWEALHASKAEHLGSRPAAAVVAAEARTVQERRQASQVCHAAIGAASVHWEDLPASDVARLAAMDSVTAAAFAAAAEDQSAQQHR